MKSYRYLGPMAAVAAICCCGCTSGTGKLPASTGGDSPYKLLWSDEFDGAALSKENWNVELRESGWTNHELQAYTAAGDTVFLRDGCLVLKAVKKEAAGGKAIYTSGKVNSQGKRDFTYGKVLIRARVPEGKGLWPAAWMMPTREDRYGQWPRCGEIDIMEVLGNESDKMYGTIHYGVPHRQSQGSVKLEKGSFASDFHEYAVEWEPGEISFLLDGSLYYKTDDWFTAKTEDGAEEAYPAPFNQPFFIQMNLAVGGDWPGSPDAATDFSKAELVIDYVRVYQRESYNTQVTRKEKKLVMREPDSSGNLIHNGSFSTAESLTDDADWKFLVAGKGKATAAVKDGSFAVMTEDGGELDYSVQVVQPGLPVRKDQKYQITFEARSSQARKGRVALTAPEANWVRYFPDTPFDMGKDWKTYTYSFTMTQKDDAKGRLEFNLGNLESTAPVFIRNVRFEALK